MAVGRIALTDLHRDRGQLFAEACARFRAGAAWWPDRVFEAAHIRAEQEARYEADAWEGPVAEFLEKRARATVLEVAAGAVGVDKARLGRVEQNRIVACLGRAGWVRGARSQETRWWVPGTPLSARGEAMTDMTDLSWSFHEQAHPTRDTASPRKVRHVRHVAPRAEREAHYRLSRTCSRARLLMKLSPRLRPAMTGLLPPEVRARKSYVADTPTVRFSR